MSVRISAVALSVAAVISSSWMSRAQAVEDLTPFLFGGSTGAPTGALPPDGFYMTNDIFHASGGSLVQNNGKTLPVEVHNTVNVPILLWVPGWHLLGADYAMSVIQPYGEHNVDTSAIGGESTKTSGFFNTILTPAILSWNLGHGFHVGTGVSVYLPDGHHHYEDGAPLQTNYANDYWTLEPNFAISYLANGWNITINNVFDINRTNQTTDYKSGNLYYLDMTASKTIGKWTFGVIGNYTRQLADDYQYGQVVGEGNRLEHVLVGPLLSYNFGKAEATLRYLQNVKTRNDVDVSIFFASVSFKF